METETVRQGAQILPQGVRYTAWAPKSQRVEAEILTEGGGVARTVPLLQDGDGYFYGLDPVGREGDRYKIRLEGEKSLPPPAAQWQPEGVQGPSQVVRSHYAWTDQDWRRPTFRDLIIYELHIGTFSPEGTFRGAIGKLPYLRELGVNSIEIMPVADFPGNRNWGYDGVQLYAPAHCYGPPDDFRALVDAAHAQGIAVILDVVYNHFGPDGNYLSAYSPYYFSSKDKTPWGDAINFGHENSQPVREFFRQNIIFWMVEYHMDGFRLDATHAIIDHSEPHILQELAREVHARGGYIIAEDERNEAKIVTPVEQGGYGLDAVWADDFHHAVEVATIEASVYRHDFTGELHEMMTALEQGWIYSGQVTKKRGKPRGTPSGNLPPERFVFCISNHDQVGNRALGERLSHLVKPPTYRAASAMLLLAPYTPLLFMGQEWGASSPFQYFTDHSAELGKLVEEGRKQEFKDAFESSGALAEKFPSPQAEETFLRSKLRWEELGEQPYAATFALYRELIRIRQEHPEFRPRERGSVHLAVLIANVLAMKVAGSEAEWLVLCDLQGGHQGPLNEEFRRPLVGNGWRQVLSTNEPRFGGKPYASFDAASGHFDFPEAEVLVLTSDTSGK